MIIAIDGPAGSGKGTLAKKLAEKYNLVNIDTGAIYRCLALKAIYNNVDVNDDDKVIELSNSINIELKNNGIVLLDGIDVTKEIRSKEVTEIVSPISNNPKVRENMVNIQRSIAEGKNVVLDGRDICTVVFPNADYKIYLDASLECRAKRRFAEYQEKNIDMSYDEILKNIQERDYNDMNKPVGALKRCDNQIYIDSSNLTVEEELEIIDKVINNN